MDTLVIVTFAVVYLGMILGKIPGLAVDRTGVALLGAITLLAFARVQTADLLLAVDVPTIALLFGLMVLSAQFRLAGAYSQLIRRIGRFDVSPMFLLALIIGVAGVFSAVLINDIVCLAMTPMVLELCAARNLNPKPYLLGLACASNIGSAATLIGNPQNILIGQSLSLSFSAYLLESAVPVIIGLFLVLLILGLQFRHQWAYSGPGISPEAPPFNRWQAGKGTVITVLLIVIFLAGSWPRELVALAAAGILLCSRRMRSREILGLVDWQLLVLFVSLFIVNFALRQAGSYQTWIQGIAAAGFDLHAPGWLFTASVVLSNIVSNVPAVMLLLPLATHPLAGPVLALSSTLAGNLLIVGSIANIIVIEQADRFGVHISWREHARSGIPVTLTTLAVAAAWIWLRSGF